MIENSYSFEQNDKTFESVKQPCTQDIDTKDTGIGGAGCSRDCNDKIYTRPDQACLQWLMRFKNLVFSVTLHCHWT